MSHITIKGKSVSQVVTEIMERLVVQGEQCGHIPKGMKVLSCQYGDGKGNHCGIGLLLDEDKCIRSMDSDQSVEGLVDGPLLVEDEDLAKYLVDNLGTFKLLQGVHDNPERGFYAKVGRKLANDLATSCPSFKEYSERLDTACQRWKEVTSPKTNP